MVASIGWFQFTRKKWVLQQRSMLNGLFGVPGVYYVHVALEFLKIEYHQRYHKDPKRSPISKKMFDIQAEKNNINHHINLRGISWCSMWFLLRCRTSQDLNRWFGNFIWAINVSSGSEWPVDLENLPTSDKEISQTKGVERMFQSCKFSLTSRQYDFNHPRSQ